MPSGSAETLLCQAARTHPERSGWLAGGLTTRGTELANDMNDIDSIAISEVQLLLAEKRTSLAVMRTGIAVLALPLSVATCWCMPSGACTTTTG